MRFNPETAVGRDVACGDPGVRQDGYKPQGCLLQRRVGYRANKTPYLHQHAINQLQNPFRLVGKLCIMRDDDKRSIDFAIELKH